MELIKIVDARYLEGYKIEFQFNNGIKKTIDLSKEIYGEIFEPLKDIEYFKKFTLNPFTIQWENGADFAPEYLFKLTEKQPQLKP